MTTQEFLESISHTFEECLAIAKKKNSDYSDLNNPFKNFKMSEQVGVSPDRAILVRVSDKLSRISNLLDRDPAVGDESLDDSCLDIINYIAILKAYRESLKN